MAVQKQSMPSFASIISVLSIVFYCAGFLRVEHELHEQKKRINALESLVEAKPPSNDPHIIKNAPGIHSNKPHRHSRQADSTINASEANDTSETMLKVNKLLSEGRLHLCQSKGVTCSSGPPGPPGPPGPRGYKGARGRRGQKGRTGNKGDKGIMGSPGKSGKQGIMGPTGLKGETGNKGEKGDIGPAGMPGTKGDTGAAGMPGTKGDKGTAGMPGTKDDKASTGVKATIADIGPTGMAGTRKAGKSTILSTGRDSSELLKSGHTQSGLYSVNPDGRGNFTVYCDMRTEGGGWTVFQRRQDGSVDFYRGWNDYKAGFGQLTAEFWLGNDKIHRLTASRPSSLRVDLEDWKGVKAYAKYGKFKIGDEQAQYRLEVGSYSGTAGDSLRYHNKMAFTAKDRDNDWSGLNCAVPETGAWWYKSCSFTNLNGQYLGNTLAGRGAMWQHFRSTLSLKFIEMKLKPSS